MNNKQFLQQVATSFITYLKTSPRSNAKLKILHGGIAEDIKNKLENKYLIKSLGMGNGKEGKIDGRYMIKTVDILISKQKKDIAAIGVKFVMSNYSQNSNNYFENMLGETANIRANKKKYFQILILPKELPYFNDEHKITKWETITDHNIDKYIMLSKDNTDTYLHTPIKTLLFIVEFPKCDHKKIKTRAQYKRYFLKIKNLSIKISKNISSVFGETVILNDYESFINKIVFYLKSL